MSGKHRFNSSHENIFLQISPCSLMVTQIINQQYNFWDGLFVIIPMCNNTLLFLRIHLESFLVYSIFSNIVIATEKTPPYFAVIFNQCHLCCGHKCYVTNSCYCQISVSEHVKLLSPTLFVSANAQGHTDLVSARYSAYSVSIPSFSYFPKHLKMPRSVYWYQNTWRQELH